MKHLRLLALVMAILMVAAVAFSCTGSDNSKSTTTPGSSNNAGTTAPQSSSSSEEENNEDPELPGIPEGMISYDFPITDPFNLTEVGTIYWEYYGEYYGAIDDQKKDATDRIGPVDFEGGQTHYDNKAPVTWTDGTNTPVMEELRTGKNATGSINLTFTDLSGCSTIKFFVGAFQATMVIHLYDEEDNEIGYMSLFSCESDAQIAIVTIDLSKFEGTVLGVGFTPDGNNVSLTAITIS